MISRDKSQAGDQSGRIILGSANILGVRAIGIAALWVADVVIARSYGAEGSGHFYVWWTVIAIAAILSMAGIGDPLVREMATLRTTSRLQARALYWRTLTVVLGISLLLTALLVVTAALLDEGAGGVAMALSTIPITVMVFHLQLLRAIDRATLGSTLNHLLPSVLFALLLIVIPRTGFASLANAYLLSRVVGAAVIVGAWHYLHPHFRGSMGEADRTTARAVLRSGRRLLVAQVSEYALAWSDLLLLAILATTVETGIYAIAARIAVTLNLVQEAVNARSAPTLARLFSDRDASGLGVLVDRLTRRAALLSLVPVIGIIAFRDELLSLFGDEFVAGGVALAIVTLAQYSQVAGGPSRTLLAMSHKEDVLAKAFTLAIIGNVALNLVLIPRYGIEGAAIATLAALWTRNLIVWWQAKLHIRSLSAS